MSIFIPSNPGTVAFTANGTAIAGVGTTFRNYRAGSVINIPGLGGMQLAADPTSDTAAVGVAAWRGANTGQRTYHYEPRNDQAVLSTRLAALLEALGGGNLQAEAALEGEANRLAYFTGPGSKELTPFSQAARDLLDDANTGAMRATLEVAQKQANLSDSTAGRALLVGAFGIGNVTAPSIDNLNTLATGGLFSYSSGAVGAPTANAGQGINVPVQGVTAGIQLAGPRGGTQPRLFLRHSTGGAYTEWAEIWHSLSSPAALANLKWLSKAIGEYYVADTGEVGVDIPPTNHPAFRFIELTAGLTGAGQYNAGCLSNEQVSGSFPLVSATAVVSLATSPMNGRTIRLLNTEGRYLKPDVAGGAVANDQMQAITGASSGLWAGQTGNEGAMALSSGISPTNRPEAGTGSAQRVAFNSANSPNARTGTSTDVKRQSVRLFRRIF